MGVRTRSNLRVKLVKGRGSVGECGGGGVGGREKELASGQTTQ